MASANRLTWNGSAWQAFRISAKRNASQFTGAAGAVRRKSFLGERIKLACLRVALDRGVELLRVEYFVPRAKPRQFLRGSCSMAFSISSAVVMPRK